MTLKFINTLKKMLEFKFKNDQYNKKICIVSPYINLKKNCMIKMK